MQTFTVAAVQCHPACDGDISGNVALIDEKLRDGAAGGADLVCFPEAALTGYLDNAEAIRCRAIEANASPIQAVVQMTGKHAAYCAFGFYERCGDDIYNTYALAGEGRLIGSYRKVHIPPREKGLFSPGKEFKAFDLPFARIGFSVCFDNELPESHTCLALLGAEVIIMPTGWAEHWEREDYIEPCSSDEEVVKERQRWMHMMFGARCRDTGTYSVCINHSGLEVQGPSRFVGKSMIFAPTGRVLSEAKAWEDDMLIQSLDSKLLEQYRQMDAYILKSRRPEAYGPLTESAGKGDDG